MRPEQETILEAEPINEGKVEMNNLQNIARNNKKDRLDLYNNLIFNLQNNKLVREKLIDITTAYLEAQKEEILYEVKIKKDLTKKELYAKYQLEVLNLHQTIAKASQEMREMLLNIIQDNIVGIYKKKASWMKKINIMEKENLLNEEDKAVELKRLQKWIDDSLDELNNEIKLVADSKIKTFSDTFLFKEQK